MEEKQIVDLLKQLLQKERSIEFNKLATDYIEIYATKRKRSFEKDIRYIHRFLIPTFGNRSVSDIKTGDIQKLHSRITETAPIVANRVIEILSKMFSLAIQWDYFPGPNPCKAVSQNKERPRSRFLDEAELQRLFSVLDREKIEVRCLIYMYILTGRRKNELRTLLWKDVDMDRQTVRIFDQKKDEHITVPLPTFAIELLTCLEPTGPYVFQSNGTRIGLERQWRRIRAKSGIKDVTIHDLRRTCATWMFSSGESLDTIAELLNHSSIKTTKIYAKIKEEKIKGAVNRLGETIRAIKQGAK